ncbi:MAG: glycosyltransferase family 1 protein [Bdellovibrionales bacterium]
MSEIKKIYFIHEGKAAYPEIAAYRSFFAPSFETEEILPTEVDSRPDLSRSICWYMMGFYPQRPPAAFVIHDYRSLSVGRSWMLKDLTKRVANAKPDCRIFQNRDILRALHFRQDVPTVFLPMGVPDFVTDYRLLPTEPPLCDFCYIGVMSRERRSHRMLNSFLKRFGVHKTFYLFGEPEPGFAERYAAYPNIVFQGRKSQEDVFAALRRSRVAVNYFPTHHPHKWQTPTKLLEYASLGLRILSNEQVQSRHAVQAYGVQTLWGPTKHMFCNVPDRLDWPDNSAFDPTPLLWPSVIDKSGIARRIEEGIKA